MKAKSIYRPRKDRPFRPEPIPETLYGVISLLQRAPEVQNLQAVLSPYTEVAHLEFSLGRETFCIYPRSLDGTSALWNRTEGAFLAENLKLETLIETINFLIKEEKKTKRLKGIKHAIFNFTF